MSKGTNIIGKKMWRKLTFNTQNA